MGLQFPDLTPCDFFLWIYLKHNVYSSPIKYLAHLRQRISEEIILIEPETLKNAFLNMKKRLQLIKKQIVVTLNNCYNKYYF